ncbi:MAG TPA: alpha-amylase family glycosyl hydrolase, partial [Burkholderiales bacterium]|nr:alpha-amylase family glycosyl hydrolase [Burkholderiales bacterium]
MKRLHHMPFGAQVLENGGTRFRLWAPSAQRIDLLLQGETRAELPMRNIDGWFETVVSNVGAGTRYAYRVDGGLSVPDPASRNNPQDVHGPSEVVDPTAFDWSDVEWRGRPWEEAVIYELHVGTFTPEGTYAAAERRLDYLRDLGVTVIELMPVAQFAGKRNWGYDGVLPFAPDNAYGSADDLKRFVQAAHQRGLMTLLDVVYNHFG